MATAPIDFDLTLLKNLGYDKLKELSQEYLNSDNPDVKELGKTIAELDVAALSLTPQEGAFREFLEQLIAKGKTPEFVQNLALQVVNSVYDAVVKEIIGAMNEDALQKWNAAKDMADNDFQNMYLLNETSKMLLGKDMDQLFSEHLNKVTQYVKEAYSSTEQLASQTSKLSANEKNIIISAIDNGEPEIALQLIYTFTKENE